MQLAGLTDIAPVSIPGMIPMGTMVVRKKKASRRMPQDFT